MSTKSKARAARRAEQREEHGPTSQRFTERERVIVGELMAGLLATITFGVIDPHDLRT